MATGLDWTGNELQWATIFAESWSGASARLERAALEWSAAASGRDLWSFCWGSARVPLGRTLALHRFLGAMGVLLLEPLGTLAACRSWVLLGSRDLLCLCQVAGCWRAGRWSWSDDYAFCFLCWLSATAALLDGAGSLLSKQPAGDTACKLCWPCRTAQMKAEKASYLLRENDCARDLHCCC